MLMSRRKSLPTVLTKEEQKKLVSTVNLRYPTGERNKLIMIIMLDTGLRLSEATNLRWRDINLMSGKLMVREGKGAKDRTLWIPVDDLDLVESWKERQVEEMRKRDINKRPEFVFTTLKGGQLDNRYVREMVYRCVDKTDIEKGVSPHTLRHTFATDLYRETKDIRLVQKALGHEDLSTTMIYTHIVDDELEDSMKNFRKGRDF